MLTKHIKFENFSKKKKYYAVKKNLEKLIKENNEIIKSLKSSYKDNFSKKFILKFKKFQNTQLIGMGGSVLGSKTIYNFLSHKIKKRINFVDNLLNKSSQFNHKKKLNLIISKSGNTLETITNTKFIVKKTDTNLFITGSKTSLLKNLAKKLKADIMHQNDFIGGRYSVLSEVGMLPAELMGLNKNKFRRLNYLIKNKIFMNSLVQNVSNTINFIDQKKFNSIILNYDEKSLDLFYWYQQLIAESLGKKKKGLLPIISLMPKDNHSLMQLYLDGFQNNFFTFFYVHDHKTDKINNNLILQSKKNLKNKTVSEIIYSQKIATENVFKSKKIPFRSFEVKIRNEKTLGELFCFFILETILIGKCLNLNPFDQPAVELIKKETNKLLI